MTKFVCSIYRDRPEPCRNYPWNGANQIFLDCQFYDAKKQQLLTQKELELVKTEKEISDFCVNCGQCCFFGPAACSKLQIM